MFQSIKYLKHLGYNKKTKLHSYEYNLTDSDFGCGVGGVEHAVVGAGAVVVAVVVAVGAIIKEYTKRNLNIAANLVKFFLYYEEETGHSIADQIEFAEKYQPLFTPKLKADIEKYMVLL